MLFPPPQAEARQQCEALFARIIGEEGARLLGWRDVPVKSDAIGVVARSTEPFMRQVFIARDVLKKGMEAKSREFTEKGSELYAKA